MKTVRRRIRFLIAWSWCPAFLLAAAGSAQGVVLDFAAYMDGVCSGSGAPQLGWGSFSIDTNTNVLTYRVEYDPSIMNITFAHLHHLPDACGQVPGGPVVVTLNTPGNPMVGTWNLVPQEVEAIAGAEFYANIHTAKFPDGVVSGILYSVPKSRYISFFPRKLTESSTAATQAIRVKLVSLHHPDPPTAGSPDFTASEGGFRWVGAPASSSDAPAANIDVASLQCTPEFRDWSTVPWVLHVSGSEVVPSSVYEVQVVDDTCADLNDPGCYSAPFTVWTVRWGDVFEPYAEYTGGGQPNFGDISRIVSKFQGVAGAVTVPRADLAGPTGPGIPNVPNRTANFGDVSVCVSAFSGFPYPYTLPTPCE